MRKKIYQTPQMKVVKVKAHQMLCGSFGAKQQNESYEEVDVSAEGWY